MNSHDQSNLDFLMNIDKETLQAWFESVSDDDHRYAMGLLHAAQIELVINTEVEDLSDAESELSRFTLKGKA